MKFSICIPNYNYDQYLGITLDSVMEQSHKDFEVVITDNASTDNSLGVIEDFASRYPNIRYQVNATNVGFAGNLDEVARMAREEFMIMLSSDDLMTENALSDYNKFINKVKDIYGDRMIFCSRFEKIDGKGNFIEYISASASSMWYESDIDQELSALMGYTVYKVKSGELLKRCLNNFQNPFNFAATCYPKKILEEVGSYGGGRLYNPDKWFHWKMLGSSDYAFYLDAPLFKYRWHENNQASFQQKSGVLKFWLDEYRNSFEVDQKMTAVAGLTKEQVIENFCTHLMKYVFAAIKQNDKFTAKRLWHFGLASYPQQFRKNRFFLPLGILLCFMPISSYVCKLFYK